MILISLNNCYKSTLHLNRRTQSAKKIQTEKSASEWYNRFLRSLQLIVWFVSDFEENEPFTGTLKVKEEYSGIVSGGKTETYKIHYQKKERSKGRKFAAPPKDLKCKILAAKLIKIQLS